ncbi:unnamed protein product, partial [Medioppia subpectinata]
DTLEHYLEKHDPCSWSSIPPIIGVHIGFCPSFSGSSGPECWSTRITISCRLKSANCGPFWGPFYVTLGSERKKKDICAQNGLHFTHTHCEIVLRLVLDWYTAALQTVPPILTTTTNSSTNFPQDIGSRRTPDQPLPRPLGPNVATTVHSRGLGKREAGVGFVGCLRVWCEHTVSIGGAVVPTVAVLLVSSPVVNSGLEVDHRLSHCLSVNRMTEWWTVYHNRSDHQNKKKKYKKCNNNHHNCSNKCLKSHKCCDGHHINASKEKHQNKSKTQTLKEKERDRDSKPKKNSIHAKNNNNGNNELTTKCNNKKNKDISSSTSNHKLIKSKDNHHLKSAKDVISNNKSLNDLLDNNKSLSNRETSLDTNAKNSSLVVKEFKFFKEKAKQKKSITAAISKSPKTGIGSNTSGGTTSCKPSPKSSGDGLSTSGVSDSCPKHKSKTIGAKDPKHWCVGPKTSPSSGSNATSSANTSCDLKTIKVKPSAKTAKYSHSSDSPNNGCANSQRHATVNKTISQSPKATKNKTTIAETKDSKCPKSDGKRKNKVKIIKTNTLYDEDIIDGFAILSFKTFDDIEVLFDG